jgi:hypothetical protein
MPIGDVDGRQRSNARVSALMAGSSFTTHI